MQCFVVKTPSYMQLVPLNKFLEIETGEDVPRIAVQNIPPKKALNKKGDQRNFFPYLPPPRPHRDHGCTVYIRYNVYVTMYIIFLRIK